MVPIEWKVEEKFKKRTQKDEIDVIQFRRM